MGHASKGPSNHRWPHCPGSLAAEKKYPYETSQAAIDGTGSHLLKEMVQETRDPNARAEMFLGKNISKGHKDKPGGWLVKQDRCDRVNMALTYFRRRNDEMGGCSIDTETRSDPGFIFGRNDWWGTVDDTLISLDRTILEVADYKDGQMPVYVRDKRGELNTQLVSYAGGGLIPYLFSGEGGHNIPNIDNCSIKTVRLTIIQPKTTPVMKYEDVSVAEVWEAVKKLAIAAKRCDDEPDTLIAGDWCTWCKHGKAGNCPAKNQIALEGINQMLPANTAGNDDLITMIQSGQISAETADDATIANVLDAGSAIKALIDQFETEADKRLEAKTFTDPRYEFGYGRSSKKWIEEDDDKVWNLLKGMRVLKGEAYPAKLITPAAAIALAKEKNFTDRQTKKLVETMIKKVPGNRKVVRSSTAASPAIAASKDVNTMFLDPTVPEIVESVPSAAIEVPPTAAAINFLN